jgi:hypothetical protein
MFVSDAYSSSIDFDSNQIPGTLKSIDFGSKSKRATLRTFRQCIHWRRRTDNAAVQFEKACGKDHFSRLNGRVVGFDCLRDFVLELERAPTPSKVKRRATRSEAESRRAALNTTYSLT